MMVWVVWQHRSSHTTHFMYVIMFGMCEMLQGFIRCLNLSERGHINEYCFDGCDIDVHHFFFWFSLVWLLTLCCFLMFNHRNVFCNWAVVFILTANCQILLYIGCRYRIGVLYRFFSTMMRVSDAVILCCGHNNHNLSGLYRNSASCLGWWSWRFLCAMCKCWRLGLCYEVCVRLIIWYIIVNCGDLHLEPLPA